MKKLFATLLCLMPFIGMAQEEYQTFIYTSDDLAAEIQQQSSMRGSRGYLSDLFDTSKEAVKGIGAGYVTSFIDIGVNAIGSLLTHNARMKEQWEKSWERESWGLFFAPKGYQR